MRDLIAAGVMATMDHTETQREYAIVVNDLARLKAYRKAHPADKQVVIDAALYESLLEQRKGLIEMWAKRSRTTLSKTL